MEKALRYELSQIAELNKRIFPTHAPEGQPSPYLVYVKSDYRPTKTLQGYQKQRQATYLLNILCDTYEALYDVTKNVEEIVLSLPLHTIGQGKIYVQDLTINNIAETYENELALYRSIIDLTVTYEEV